MHAEKRDIAVARAWFLFEIIITIMRERTRNQYFLDDARIAVQTLSFFIRPLLGRGVFYNGYKIILLNHNMIDLVRLTMLYSLWK